MYKPNNFYLAYFKMSSSVLTIYYKDNPKITLIFTYISILCIFGVLSDNWEKYSVSHINENSGQQNQSPTCFEHEMEGKEMF